MKKYILIIGLISLLLSSSVIPLSIGYEIKTPNIKEESYNRGNTLYVGGSGPSNYTKIQDAIDDSNEGDTVFVYNGIYYEWVVVDKAINLIGEEKSTTVIDGMKSEDVVYISSNNVHINGFTIQNSGKYSGAGIDIRSSNNIIENCIVTNNCNGILFWSRKTDDNKITQCIIKDNTCGIQILEINSDIDMLIELNIISNNKDYGIYIQSCVNPDICINIIDNTIKYNGYDGLLILESNVFINVTGNTFSENKIGLSKVNNNLFQISDNNFINNTLYNAWFLDDQKSNKHIWSGNYWYPRSIKFIKPSSNLPELIFGKNFIFNIIGIKMFNIDWNPSTEPYPIKP